MFITDPEKLKQFRAECRLWQGIPGIERTKKGRIFVCFYSGGTKEWLGNFCLLTCSDDDGDTFLDPIAAVFNGDDFRCYNPCLWLDPLGRLWFFWNVSPEHAVWASVCSDPDAEQLLWSEPRCIGKEVLTNKPTVLHSGQWLLPMGVWDVGVGHTAVSDETDRRPFVWKSNDNGRSFYRLGGPIVENRSYDEHMVVEMRDGSLFMLSRTKTGLAESRSYDGGETWLKAKTSKIKGPSSRFFLRRLRSGRWLLLNHHNFDGRNNMTAMLSEDEGVTWQGFLLLDERNNVSSPDAVETENGDIYIVYDRNRGSYLHSLEEVYAQSREILMAKVTEADILAGQVVTEGSFLKKVVNKLGRYCGPLKDPYDEWGGFTTEKYAAELIKEPDNDKLLERIFTDFGFQSLSLNRESSHLLDHSLDQLMDGDTDGDPQKRLYLVRGIVSILRGSRTSESSNDVNFIIDGIFALIAETLRENISLDEMAEHLHVNKYYMCHLFRERTGVSIMRYRNSRRLSLAKELLSSTDLSIAAISDQCGFNTVSYFGEAFKRQEHLSPGEYRAMHRGT